MIKTLPMLITKKRMHHIWIKNNNNRELIKNKKDTRMTWNNLKQKSRLKQSYQIIHQKQIVAL